MSIYKGLLFQGGFFSTPASLELLGAVEESIGLAGDDAAPLKRESRPGVAPAAASVSVGRDADCCPA